ncbi:MULTISPECIES: MFS transporter [Burkholderia]|uniref:MFS transporter n=1 Tax=Burkholderia TaxID=32008 RepID=UPI00025F0569|nr:MULTISPECIES: MFS transporter [Burkholderia]AFJ88074.1 Sialic acid transporter NanT [Burkholderia sp. KJ006]KVE00153.1 MFS transporter [Burkholderia vietnamiensis]KVR91901.1 MFS transporter [Burkholderia vietnamiensis]MBR8160569.1 MFS transporter [Burkholderia vietnamiensis]MBR8201152.1 MFS transporter [Burkholderia vietnamiensis]
MESKTLAAPAADPTGPARNDNGLFGWYAHAQPRERRAFWSCKVGYMLDGMDTQMLSFVIPTLVATWGISLADAGFIGTMTLLASALGGWLAGILSDRIGRVRTLQLTVLWFAVFTALCGLAQNYSQLLAARALMGFGFGGEWTAGAVLIGEVIRARDRGKAVGLVQSGWAIGWGLAALLYALLFSVLPAEQAWRALFLVGLAPALLVVVIRRYVKEPDVYEKEKAAQRATDAPRLTEIFAPKLLSTTLRAALLTTGAQGGYYAITTWLPTFLKTERHLTVMGTGGYLATIIVGSWIGYLTSAYLTDRLGRKPNFILFALGSMVIAFAYTSPALHLTNMSMLWLGFPLGFFASGIFSGMGAFLTELFPTRVRGSGQGFCYNVGRAVGALFPFLIGALSKHYGLGASIGIFAVAAYGVLIVAALTLPETRGRELDAA